MLAEQWILGDPFLRAFLQIYDVDNMRVGLLAVEPNKPIGNSSNVPLIIVIIAMPLIWLAWRYYQKQKTERDDVVLAAPQIELNRQI